MKPESPPTPPSLEPPPQALEVTLDQESQPSSPPDPTQVPVVIPVVVVVVLVALAAVLMFFLVRRWRRQREEVDVSLPQWNPSPSESQPKKLGEEEGTEFDNSTDTSAQKSTDTWTAGRSNFRPLIPPDTVELVQLPESYKTDTSSNSGLSVGVRTFTFEELSEATDQFSKDNFLGRGGFGSVYRGVLVLDGGDGVVVAIKKLHEVSSQGEHEFITEINVISRVHHRNLVSLVGYCISGVERLLVYEYVENNTLAFHLQGAVSTQILDWPSRMSIALGAAKGIAYLHEECHPRIIHRDIKSTNILLDSNFSAKVADFGLAKDFPDDKTHVSTRIIGTFGYLDPEYATSGTYTEKSDVFSFGVVLLELITGQKPTQLLGWTSPLLDQVLRGGKVETGLVDPKLKNNYDYKEMSRMVTCAAVSVRPDPKHRPRMSQVVQVLEGNISPQKLIKAQTSNPRRDLLEFFLY